MCWIAASKADENTLDRLAENHPRSYAWYCQAKMLHLQHQNNSSSLLLEPSAQAIPAEEGCLLYTSDAADDQ